MTFLMYLVDPKDNILKVSWRYLNFLQKYKHLKNQGYKQGYEQGYEHVVGTCVETLVSEWGTNMGTNMGY